MVRILRALVSRLTVCPFYKLYSWLNSDRWKATNAGFWCLKSTRVRWFYGAYHFQLVQVEGVAARHSQDPPFQWKECSSVAALNNTTGRASVLCTAE